MALGLLDAGARVVAIEHAASRQSLDDLLEAAGQMGERERIFGVIADVTDAESCADAVQQSIVKFGDLHALINNAGLHIDIVTPYVMSKPPPFYETSAQQWKKIIDVNVNGPFNMALAITPHFVANGFGRIVNLTTGYRVMTRAGTSAYGPSKAALEAATVVWAADLQGTGITVNALSPGSAADTGMIPAIDVPDRSTLLAPSALVPPAVWLTLNAPDSFTAQRITAKLWDPGIGVEENLRVAGAPAAWR